MNTIVTVEQFKVGDSLQNPFGYDHQVEFAGWYVCYLDRNGLRVAIRRVFKSKREAWAAVLGKFRDRIKKFVLFGSQGWKYPVAILKEEEDE